MNLDEYLRAIPKVSLHCHLEGSVQATTVADLARKHGEPLPGNRTAENLYEYPDILEFLKVYTHVAGLIRDYEDFHRVAYETLQEAHDHGVRYREMFWSPMAHMAAGVSYETAVDGLIAGIRDAETDLGVRCRLIADIDRMQEPEAGLEMLDAVLEHRRPELIGIGLDYAEAGNPPEKHWKAFARAGRAGLHRTAHTCEDAPARNVETSLDLLGCERIDHGYHVLGDESLVRRCANEGVVFTCAPVSTAWVYFGNDFENHPIREMVAKGLKVMLDCDDPPMFGTNPSNDYAVAAAHMGFGPEDFREMVLNGIDGCWLDDTTKRRMRRDWGREIDALTAQLEGSGTLS
jgi:adenosine deaminase